MSLRRLPGLPGAKNTLTKEPPNAILACNPLSFTAHPASPAGLRAPPLLLPRPAGLGAPRGCYHLPPASLAPPPPPAATVGGGGRGGHGVCLRPRVWRSETSPNSKAGAGAAQQNRQQAKTAGLRIVQPGRSKKKKGQKAQSCSQQATARFRRTSTGIARRTTSSISALAHQRPVGALHGSGGGGGL